MRSGCSISHLERKPVCPAPHNAGRTLDVASTGEAGIDLNNKLDTAGILPSAAAGAAALGNSRVKIDLLIAFRYCIRRN